MTVKSRQMMGRPTLLLLIAALGAFAPTPLLAHPMGNFSISHFAGLRIQAGAVELRYILDLAEIPTFQEMQAANLPPAADDPRVVAYLARKAEELKGGLAVTLNSAPVTLETASESVIFPPGAGNLPTMKIGVVYHAVLTGVECPCMLGYSDGNYAGRAGWKEVVVSAGTGATLVKSTAAATSRSEELANYPTDLINSPPQDLAGQATFMLVDRLTATGSDVIPAPGPPQIEKTRGAVKFALQGSEGSKLLLHPPAHAASNVAPPFAVPGAEPSQKLALAANKQGTPRNRFTELITSNDWGLWFMLTAALIAAALGGLHAMEPGHGKTIVAAYLVGSQGTAAHALLLGLIVSATHTAGVYALGLATLYASKYIVPDHLYPWLGVASGVMIAVLGIYMLRRRLAGLGHAHGHLHHHGPWGHSHKHSPAHDHTHDHAVPGHTHSHSRSYAHHHDDAHNAGHPDNPFSYRQLVTLGVTGGIVPCPAALVVLLSAVSLDRVAFGLYLIVAFSLGLATVLISIGMVTVYARRLLARLPTDGPLINRWLPTASAAAITCLGIGIAAQAAIALA